MNVLHLLAHDRLALDKLRMITFLPNLVGASGLVGTLEYVSASRQDWKGVGLAAFAVGERYSTDIGIEGNH